jgi:hypothetical protein
MSFRDRDAQIYNEILSGQRVDLVFELLEPVDELASVFALNACALVREIRSDVAISENRPPRRKLRFNPGSRFVAIAGVEKRGEMSVHGIERPEITIQKARDQFAEESFIAREADLTQRNIALGKGASEHVELRPFSGAVNSFKDDEFSARWHRMVQSLADSQNPLLP